MKILITGGLGFLGSNLACESINRGYNTIIFDNFFRDSTTLNYNWLKEQGEFTLENKDIRQWYDIEETIKKYKPDVIFHTAGQVAMTTSLNNPRLDFEVNALGTFNLLEAVRKYSPETAILFSSTNKVYGDLEYVKNLYFKIVDNIDECAGEAFNIGGGIDNILSLLELFGFLEDELDIEIKINKKPWRYSEQMIFVADINKINKYTGWKPNISKEEGLRKMIKWSNEMWGGIIYDK